MRYSGYVSGAEATRALLPSWRAFGIFHFSYCGGMHLGVEAFFLLVAVITTYWAIASLHQNSLNIPVSY